MKWIDLSLSWAPTKELLSWTIAVKYTAHVPWWKVKEKNLKIILFTVTSTSLMPATRLPVLLLLSKLQCDFWNDLKYITRGQDVVVVKKWPKRRGKLMLGPRVDHVGFVFHKLKIKWTSNLSVSFQLEITILVSFEKYSNSKCNSLSKIWIFFTLVLISTNNWFIIFLWDTSHTFIHYEKQKKTFGVSCRLKLNRNNQIRLKN